jgi:type I restriction enzyme S subunit
VSEADFDDLRRDGRAPRRGDIIYSRNASLGSAAYVDTDELFCMGQDVCLITSSGDQLYLAYQLSSLIALNQIQEVSVGSTFERINVAQIRSFLVLRPPDVEQRAIAAFLDRETARIDALVAKKERLIELLQEKRTVLITRAVTKGLDPNVPMKDSGVDWMGEIPAHWEVKKIKRLFRQAKRQGHPEMTVLSVYRDYGVIEKSSRDDNFNRTPEDLDVYQVVAPGDLVINKMKAWQGSLGVSVLSGITSPDYVVYAPRHREHGRFLHHFLRNKLLANVYLTMSNGIRPSQWRLEPARFEDLSVFVPPPVEQEQIVAVVDRATARTDALIAKVREAIDRLKEFRTTLISAAVTGKIDVREEAA